MVETRVRLPDELLGDLKEGKPLIKSQTIQGNILSIIATAGTVATIFLTGAPPEILIPAVTGAGAAIWGNILSIFGRVKATEKIK